jgi:hypothetical protein
MQCSSTSAKKHTKNVSENDVQKKCQTCFWWQHFRVPGS